MKSNLYIFKRSLMLLVFSVVAVCMRLVSITGLFFSKKSEGSTGNQPLYQDTSIHQPGNNRSNI